MDPRRCTAAPRGRYVPLWTRSGKLISAQPSRPDWQFEVLGTLQLSCRSLTALLPTGENPTVPAAIGRDRLLHCIMSAFGTKRTSILIPPMFAFGGKADIAFLGPNVRF